MSAHRPVRIDDLYEQARTERARLFVSGLARLLERWAARLRRRAERIEATPSRAR